MRLNTYGSLPHYREHTSPVLAALPSASRGDRWGPVNGTDGVTMYRAQRGAEGRTEPVLVASYSDAVAGVARGRPVVYLEHGAGQAYDGDPAMVGRRGWSGGDGLENVVLFLCPNETVAQRWRARYSARAVAVGCPKLDLWHQHGEALRQTTSRLTVAVTFHWDCPLGPETRSTWSYWDRALVGLVQWARSADVELIGHGHPRMWAPLRRRWQSLGVEPVAELNEVMARADVLVADNSSAMYEFASLGRPVVALNAPWYRRDVEHGLRFWSHVPGVQCDHPRDLVEIVAAELAAPAKHQPLRDWATTAAYAHTDGHAAERAAAAIMETLT